MATASVKLPDLAAPEAEVIRRDDGSFIIRSPHPLNPSARCIGEYLEKWAVEAPDRPLFSERSKSGEWVTCTYGDALKRVRSIASALLQRGLGVDRPVAILSGNSVNHALLTLAAQHVGVPVAPISVAYSLMSGDHAKLKGIMEMLQPGLVFAEQQGLFANAVAACSLGDAELVSAGPDGETGWSDFNAFLNGPVDQGAVDAAFAGVSGDTIAKFLFTSGSTGLPKGVINTQTMLCANQEMIAQCWPFIEEESPVLVDWLPWNHTFGGNHNTNLILRNGGTMYIDQGKPMPGLIETSVENLKSVSPTMLFNVPRGFDMLLPFLESDEALRDSLFRRLKIIFNAGAALPASTSDRLNKVVEDHLGYRIPVIGAWGATETAPMVTSIHFIPDSASNIGLPAPGTEILMTPNGEKFEMRVRGPNVTPGYWRRDDLTCEAFDDEGFYRIGDAGRLADENDPSKGIEFDGRVAENFKLVSGTWVHVGELRVNIITAFSPLVQDAVIVGENQDTIGLLIFPNLPACAKLAGLDVEGTAPGDILSDERVRAEFARLLAAFAAAAKGSSGRPTRLILMEEPPQIDANEVTDKGYVNQRAVKERRSALIDGIYADPPVSAVISVD